MTLAMHTSIMRNNSGRHKGQVRCVAAPPVPYMTLLLARYRPTLRDVRAKATTSKPPYNAVISRTMVTTYFAFLLHC